MSMKRKPDKGLLQALQNVIETEKHKNLFTQILGTDRNQQRVEKGLFRLRPRTCRRRAGLRRPARMASGAWFRVWGLGPAGSRIL